MKRIAAGICLALLLFMMTASVALAAPFAVEETSPRDGDTGMAIENMGVKVRFNQPVYSEDNQNANTALCSLVDKDGKTVPIRVLFNPDDEDVILILADTAKGAVIEATTEYTLTIGGEFTAADGSALGEPLTLTFETLNPKTSMTASMVMMGLMVVGMVYFTSRTAKKEAQKAKEQKDQPINPYKVAKETGKSVEEIVAAEQKKKEKKAQKDAKKKRQKEENKVEISPDNKRVSKPRPISQAGSSYKTGRAELAAKKAAEQRAKQEKKQQSKNKQMKKGKK